MKKFIYGFVLLASTMLAVSCAEDSATRGLESASGLTKTIGFKEVVSKAIEGSIELPDADSLYWTINAEKADNKDKSGEGLTEFDSAGITDKTITVSYGDWDLTLCGYLDETHSQIIYKTSASVTVGSKTQYISVELQCVEDSGNGTLKIHAEIPYTFGQKVFLFDQGEDGSYVLKAQKTLNYDEALGTSNIDLEASLSSGVHSIRVGVGETRDTLRTTYDLNVAILNNITTLLTMENKTGEGSFKITIKEYQAIVEDAQEEGV